MSMEWLKNEKGKNYLYDEVPETATGRMVHIGVLRSTQSYNIFTTEGSELNLASTDITVDGDEKIQRIVMFKRKQVASERRKGKELLRGLIEQIDDKIERGKAFGKYDDSEELCRLHDNLCGLCIDCKLYGFANAAKSDGSRTSRVLTDSAFSIRGLERRQDISFSAQSEETERESQSHALNTLAHAKPETFFPSIVTLKDATEKELKWLLHLIRSTTRYGAETSRTGYMDNEIVSVWFDNKETLSNLELTQRIRNSLSEEELKELSKHDVKSAMKDQLPDSEVKLKKLKEELEEELEDDKSMVDFLEMLHKKQVGDETEGEGD